MKQHHLTISRNVRYATLGQTGPNLQEVWFVCHGYGQLAHRFLHYFAGLNDGTRLIVAPEGLSRYYVDHAERKVGASWMTSEDRLTDIADYVAYLDRLHDVVLKGVARERIRLHALGFSQGTATVSRWAVLGKVRVDRLILWGGLVPPDLDLDVLGDPLRSARLTLVVGEEDEYVRPASVQRAEARLREAEIPYELVSFPGGHRLDRGVLESLAAR